MLWGSRFVTIRGDGDRTGVLMSAGRAPECLGGSISEGVARAELPEVQRHTSRGPTGATRISC
ncbi:MAG: hypothetical protein JWN86_2281 [Planctomycetota bacterium]|nr:hypothetical protein [Planctomycetota bacterium]